MTRKKERDDLQAAQANAASKEAALAKARDARRALAKRVDLLKDELQIVKNDEAEDLRRAADCFIGGGDPVLKIARKKSLVNIEEELDRLAAIAEVVDADISALEREVANAREDVGRLVDAVMAAHMADVLADAHKLRDRLDALLALLSVAKDRHIAVDGVWPFLMRPGHQISQHTPALKSAACLFRTWHAALEVDANAEPDLTAAAALEKAEADRDAAAAAVEKEEEERRVAEIEARQAAYLRNHPREPVTPTPQLTDNILHVY